MITSVSGLSTGLSSTNSYVATLSTGLTTLTGNFNTYTTNTATGTTGNIASLSTSTSTGLGIVATTMASLSTSHTTVYNTGTKYFHANSLDEDSVATGKDAVAMGLRSTASGDNTFAAGNGAKATANGATAVGFGAQATGVNAIAIGTGARASGSQAFGANAKAGGGGVAVGDNADAGGEASSATVGVSRGTAIGFGAVVHQSGGVALGSGAVASRAAGEGGYVPGVASASQQAAIKATTSTQAAASLGDAASGQLRQLTGVAAGSQDSDAANVAQLKAASEGARASTAQYATHPDGTIDYTQMELGNGQAPDGTRLGNVARGVLPNDAVNMAQFNELRRDVQEVERIAYSGIAMALAMSGAITPSLNAGDRAVGVGLGHYKGYGAVALAFKALASDGQMSWGAGLSSTGRDWGINAGIGWKWH